MTTATRQLLSTLRRWIEPGFEATIRQIEGLGLWCRAQLDQRDQIIKQLTDRVAELEQRTAQTMSYAGIWEAGAEYQPCDVTTYGGVIWFAWKATTDKPGTSEAWQLMVKGVQR